MKRFWGIQKRAIFLAVAPAAIIAVALSVYFLVVRYGDVEEALQNRGQALARQLAPAAEYGAFAGNRNELSRLALAAAREPDVLAVRIYDEMGALLASAGNSPASTGTPHQDADSPAVEVFEARINRPAVRFDDLFEASGSPSDGARAPLGKVVLELSRSHLKARKREILAVTVLMTLLVVGVALLLAHRLGRDITEPVLALEDAVARIRAGKLDLRVAPHPSGTLTSLEAGLNEMVAALQANQRRSASALAYSEAELAKQLTFAQALLDAQSDAGVGLMIIENGRIVFTNRAIERIFGYSSAEIHSMPSFLELVDPEERLTVERNHVLHLRDAAERNHYDVALRRKNGDRGYADITVATLRPDGRVRLLCMVVDITECKWVESRLADANKELLAKKEEAERASEGKSRFLAAASHDLRQPLHALRLFATELAGTAKTARNQRLAAQIVSAAEEMAELLDALLEVSRLDIAAVQPQRRAISLETLLESIADAHEQSAKAKGLRLVRRPTAFWVDSDPQLLRRMIGNLVANAVRYTEHGGLLLAARHRGDLVSIEIWDTGIGIDEAHLPYLFQEFYQVGNPERDSAKGLGLGLAIVARLGHILGHPIHVRSRPGQGSVFTITVPRAKEMPAALLEAPTGIAARSYVVLHTADVEQRRLLCDLLDDWNYERECPETSEQLPRSMAAGPAAVICDAALLGDVAAHLPGLANSPQIITLGEAAESPVTVTAHLPLPVRPARLRALLRHLLSETEESPPEE